jgi:hypothetical protein
VFDRSIKKQMAYMKKWVVNSPVWNGKEIDRFKISLSRKLCVAYEVEYAGFRACIILKGDWFKTKIEVIFYEPRDNIQDFSNAWEALLHVQTAALNYMKEKLDYAQWRKSSDERQAEYYQMLFRAEQSKKGKAVEKLWQLKKSMGSKEGMIEIMREIENEKEPEYPVYPKEEEANGR